MSSKRNRQLGARKQTQAGSACAPLIRDEALACAHDKRALLPPFSEFYLPDACMPVKDGCVVGVCVCLDRSYPLVSCARGILRAQFSAALISTDRSATVCVGDYLVLRFVDADISCIIESIIPRLSEIKRYQGRNYRLPQVLAANVDIVAIVVPLSKQGVSIEKVARALCLCATASCEPFLIFTKADRITPERLVKECMRAQLLFGSKLKIFALSLFSHGRCASEEEYLQAAGQIGVSWGLEALASALSARVVDGGNDAAGAADVEADHDDAIADADDSDSSDAASDAALHVHASELSSLSLRSRSDASRHVSCMLLGESGVGKSSLINALCDSAMLEVGATRMRDDKGRHTTTQRLMLRAAPQVFLIDCPGIRSFSLVGQEAGLYSLFPEFKAALGSCAFSNCTHIHEKGCALEALSRESAALHERYLLFASLLQALHHEHALSQSQ